MSTTGRYLLSVKVRHRVRTVSLPILTILPIWAQDYMSPQRATTAGIQMKKLLIRTVTTQTSVHFPQKREECQESGCLGICLFFKKEVFETLFQNQFSLCP